MPAKPESARVGGPPQAAQGQMEKAGGLFVDVDEQLELASDGRSALASVKGTISNPVCTHNQLLKMGGLRAATRYQHPLTKAVVHTPYILMFLVESVK